LELSSQNAEGLAERLLALLTEAAESGLIKDAAVAASEAQRADFWRLRDNLSEAQRYEGASIKHDVSVAVTDVPAFLEEVETALAKAAPGARFVAFGHLGDGNIHCNVSQPIGADKAAFLARWREINTIVHNIVAQHNGSISAEHGIGQLKRDLLPQVKDPVAMELMRALKRTLDPQGILNPGKVL
jgi:FAD/FMN-containing dehydrogenase